ncbi:MAG: thiopurine S-methyltransferase [Methylophilaceae bacterium]|nr:thiopurine S-methyltransferase [Methylophilaceae bacterium]
MQHEFWHERWQQNQIGFHRDEVNAYLPQFWPGLGIAAGSQVFVPLCGKSWDMLWLRDLGYEVIGVELSALAVQAFFAENGLSAHSYQQGKFSVSEAGGIRIYCGDFFELTAELLADTAAVYDRAALVALPAEMRAVYAVHMQNLLASGTQILLVAFDYPQPEMQGPPFSVPADEVQALYQAWCKVELLHTQDILASEPRFRAKGVSRMQELVYALQVLDKPAVDE